MIDVAGFACAANLQVGGGLCCRLPLEDAACAPFGTDRSDITPGQRQAV